MSDECKGCCGCQVDPECCFNDPSGHITLLSEYIDLMNKHGYDSEEAKEFKANHVDDEKLHSVMCFAHDVIAEMYKEKYEE